MGIRLNSKEQEELVLKNMRLVYYSVNKLGAPENDYDDLISVGMIGLVKAAATFDDSKKTTFATYACRCINNEIFMNFRKTNKRSNDISLDQPIAIDSDSNELTIGDQIPNPDKDFTEEIETIEAFEKAISIVLNVLTGRERYIMLYRISEFTQEYIGGKLNISRSYVSRVEKTAINKVKTYFATNEQFEEVFSMEVVNDSYKIFFSSREIQHFNKIFATLLVNLTSVDVLCDFKVNCNKERIIIQAPANPEFFAFIAQIIQEIDDFTMEIKSNEVPVKENEEISKGKVSNKEVKNSRSETELTDCSFTDTLEGKEDILKEEFQTSTYNLNKEISENPIQVSETNEDSESEGQKGVTKVRNYFLTLETFTVSELKEKFPEISRATIANALTAAKNKNLISSISRGTYTVNKN